jgi:lysozyme
MARKINQNGLEKIKSWETLRLRAYVDESGVLTIGYGHTSAAGAPKVHVSMTITEAQAEEILRRDLEIFEKRVDSLVKVPLTDNEFAALVSFDFNTGALHTSTLLKRLNKGQYDAVPYELGKWVKITDPITGKKRKSQGLINRRALETGLWADGGPIASNTVQAEPISKPVVTRETVTWGAGIIASLASMFEGSGPVQWVLGGLIAVSFSIGLVLFLTKRLKAG